MSPRLICHHESILYKLDNLNRMGYSVQRVNVYLFQTYSLRSIDRRGNINMSLLYDRDGNRKYLTVAERTAFLKAAGAMPDEVQTLCAVLAYSGARLSEVLALTPKRIDVHARLLMVECLKKRRQGVWRAVPIPSELIAELERVHGITAARKDAAAAQAPLWGWCRTTAWSRVKECMELAGISGTQASPKGLRHAFAVAALQSGVPINFVRKWLGHSRLSTTEIYADAVGEEEQAIAGRLWGTF
ncbi:hypothetical protein CCP1ISM_180002 [Azospirillaceae bacterium]